MCEYLIKSYVEEIKHSYKERDKIDSLLKELIDSLPYKLMTIPGVNYVNASKLIAEIGDIKRFNAPSKLASYSGVAPVTYSSGQKTKHYAGKQGNRKLNSVFFRISINQIRKKLKDNKPVNPVFYEYYQSKLKLV